MKYLFQIFVAFSGYLNFDEDFLRTDKYDWSFRPSLKGWKMQEIFLWILGSNDKKENICTLKTISIYENKYSYIRLTSSTWFLTCLSHKYVTFMPWWYGNTGCGAFKGGIKN